MRRAFAYLRSQRLFATLMSFLVLAGISLGRIEPVGQGVGLIQFDSVIELNIDEGFVDWLVFARYWVCQDYYAVSVVWSEPHGLGMQDMKGLVVFSDRDNFQICDELYAYWPPLNMTYKKPLGNRPPFGWAAGMYEPAEMRFAEARALARRLHTSYFGSLNDVYQNADKILNLKSPQEINSARRKVAQVKAHIQDNRIESMELFDDQQQSLCRTRYEYQRGESASPFARLIAELPMRPETLAVDANVTNISPRGDKKTYRIKRIGHVYHKGGRMCTVTYKDVSIVDKTVRLPAQIDVRVSADNRPVRSARLMNFKHVDMDKDTVWEAAKRFAHLSDQDRACRQLVGKYLQPKSGLAPLQMEPNDLELIRQLKGHYERLAIQQDRGLGGQLQVAYSLTRLDQIVKDFDAFEQHTIGYLEILQDARLNAMYMVGGYANLEILVAAGEYDKANRLLCQWADKSATANDDDILRFARYEVLRTSHWWASLHLLDRFVQKSGLSIKQKYEGLTLRVIALHNLDKLLGSLQTVDSKRRKAQAQWILSTTNREDIAERIKLAIREAVSVRNSLGAMGQSRTTASPETSAVLTGIIEERTGQTDTRESTTER